MYLFGHVGFTLLWAYMLQRSLNIKPMKHKLAIGIGAMFPDLIDKPIGSIFFGKGRWFGHSIVFQTVFLLLSLYLIKQFELEKKYNLPLQLYSKIIYIGSICHMILDQPSLGLNVILWPFYGPIAKGHQNDFLKSAFALQNLITEAIGFFFILSIGFVEKWNKTEWKVLFIISASYILLFSVFYIFLVFL